jgi:hypothetical protein
VRIERHAATSFTQPIASCATPGCPATKTEHYKLRPSHPYANVIPLALPIRPQSAHAVPTLCGIDAKAVTAGAHGSNHGATGLHRAPDLEARAPLRAVAANGKRWRVVQPSQRPPGQGATHAVAGAAT